MTHEFNAPGSDTGAEADLTVNVTTGAVNGRVAAVDGASVFLVRYIEKRGTHVWIKVDKSKVKVNIVPCTLNIVSHCRLTTLMGEVKLVGRGTHILIRKG